MQSKITSQQNPRIKKVIQLRDRNKRKKTGLTIIEGKKEVSLALQSKVSFDAVFICSELLNDVTMVHRLKRMDAPLYDTTKQVYLKMAYGHRHEGILGIAQPRPTDLKHVKLCIQSLIVVIEGVEKPGNLGAILRTCDAAGVDLLMICDPSTDLYNPNVIRASLGAVFSVKAAVCENESAYQFLQNKKVKIISTTPSAGKTHSDINGKQSLAFILGSEHEGLSEFWLKKSDEKIKIPMKGKVDSLNLSASTAICVYEALRQRSE